MLRPYGLGHSTGDPRSAPGRAQGSGGQRFVKASLIVDTKETANSAGPAVFNNRDTARVDPDTLSFRRAPDAIGLLASGEAARQVDHTSSLCSCGETF